MSPELRSRPATMRRRVGALAIASLAAGTLAAPAATASADDQVTDGLLLHYRLDETTGGIAIDSSGNGHAGIVVGDTSWTGDEGLRFGGTDGHIRVPDNVMAGLTSITVAFDVYLHPDQAAPYFIYGFGNSSGGSGDGYLFTTGDDFRTAIATGNWSTEQNTRPEPRYELHRGAWMHVAYTQDGDGQTGVLYADGAEVARNTAVTITPGSIGGGTTTANYIGRSLYAADRFFKGRIRDFRVYDRALAASEVEQLALPVARDGVAKDTAEVALGDTSAVTADLTLPTTGPNGSRISWTSSDPAVVSDTGEVTRPAYDEDDARVTLTATLTKGVASATKSFEVRVLAMPPPHEAVRLDAAALVVHNLDDVRGNLTLPTTGANGSTISWASDDPSVITPTGEVTRPADDDVTVQLTATLRLENAMARRDFRAMVREQPPLPGFRGYAFAHMLGEGTSTGEQVHFAVSEGNDPLRWRALNDHRPVLTSRLGERGVRDPYIVRSPEGDRFYLIATDLRIFGSGPNPWDRAQRWGSRSIMVWESTDLVNWSEQRLVQVSPERAGNTWAPEAFYDPATGKYVVFWASKIYDNDEHTGSPHQRMMYATTRDFYTFSEPRPWHDPGYSVIDSTVIEHDGTYYRFTKDERNNTPPCNQFIVEEKSTSLTDLDWDFVAECIGQGDMVRGEGPIVFKSNTEEKWYLFIDEFGFRGYVPFETTDLDSGEWTYVEDIQWPGRPRHGGVLNVTAMEHARLLATPPQECTRTLTDNVDGPLEVAEGVVCLNGATVSGPVTVTGGATLVANGGRLAGGMTATQARIVALADVTVGGPLTVRDTSGWVRVTASRIAGATRVDGTTSDVAPDLSRTRITGSLSCHGNQVPPVLDGTEVAGPKFGQCRSSSELRSVSPRPHRR